MSVETSTPGPSMHVLSVVMLAIGAAACSSSTAPTEGPPLVVDLPVASHGAIDESQYNATCLTGPTDPPQISTTCPVVRWDGYDYWAMSYGDNRSSMAIHVFDPSGQLIDVTEKSGARYLYAIDIDDVARTVTFRGQADHTITMTWDDLKGLR